MRVGKDWIWEVVGGRRRRREEEERREDLHVPTSCTHASQNSRLIQICILGWRIVTERQA